MPRRFWLALATLLVLFVALLLATAAAVDRSEITQWLAKHDGVAIVVLASTAAASFPLWLTLRMWAAVPSRFRR